MFQGLKVGSPAYVLFRQEPRVAEGEVTFVSNLVPLYNGTTFQPGTMLSPKYTLDVKVSIDGQEYEFNKLPSEQSTFSYGSNSAVISDSREGIISEIEAYRTRSAKILDEVDLHKKIVNDCDDMLRKLNPQLKKEAEQAEEIANLKRGMADLRDDMTDIKGMLTKALNRKKED